MSGTATNLPIQLTLNGMPEVEAGLARVGQAARTNLAGAGAAATDASAGMGRFSQAIQQGGFQLNDFVVQVQGGQSALTALSQQGSQFLGLFGPVGAVAGVVLSIGTIAAGFLTTSDNAEKAGKTAEDALARMKRGAADAAAVIKEMSDAYLTAAQRAQALVQTERQGRAERINSSLDEVRSQRSTLRSQLDEEGRYIRDYGAQVDPRWETGADKARYEAAVKLAGDLNNKILELGSLETKLLNEQRKAVSNLPLGSDVDKADALRDRLDKRGAALRDYKKTLDDINSNPAFNDADKARLATLALNERDEAIKRLDESTKKAAKSTREFMATAYEINEDGSQGASFQRAASVETYLERLRGRQTRQTEADDKKATAARERAEKEQERANERAQDRLDRTAERWGDNLAQETVSALETGFKKGQSLAQVTANLFGSALRSAASAGLSQMVFQPIIRSALGSVAGTGVGQLAGIGGTAATASGGVSYLDTASGLFKLSGGTGSSLASGLVTSFDGYAAGFAPGVFSAGSATNNALTGLGAGVYGPATPGAVAAAEASPTMFGTASGTIGGVAGIAGGAYGIYSGIQKGGIGGAVGAAGGVAGVVGGLGTLAAAGGAVGGGLMAAAPWLAAAGPYGLAAAAVLAIVSAFLPGQKPSDMTGVYKNNLLTGESEVTGLTGDRFSQANRDLAVQIGDQVKTLAQGLQTVTGASAIPYNYEIKAGNRDGIAALYDGSWHEYDRNEESVSQLVKDMTQSLLNSMKGLASAEVQSILSHSATSDAALENLDWYNGTYKAMTAPLKEAEAAASAFAQQMTALRAPFDAAIAKATELGLATDTLAQREAAATQKLVDARSQTIKDLLQGSTDRIITANTGSPGIQRQLEVFYREQDAARRAMAEQVRTLGVGEDVVNQVLTSMVNAASAEANEYRRQYQVSQFSSLSSLQDRQAAADGSSGTLDGQLWSFDRKALLEREAASRDGVTDMVQLEKTLAEERLAIIRNFNDQAASLEAQNRSQAQESVVSTLGGITDFIRSMQTDDSSLLSPGAKLNLLGRDFSDVVARATAGDFDAISDFTSVAGNYRSAARDYYGSSSGFGAVQESIMAAAEAIGGMGSDVLTASSFAAISRQENQNLGDRIVTAIAELRQENQLLRLEMQGRTRPGDV
jgi:hypothetical protein